MSGCILRILRFPTPDRCDLGTAETHLRRRDVDDENSQLEGRSKTGIKNKLWTLHTSLSFKLSY